MKVLKKIIPIFLSMALYVGICPIVAQGDDSSMILPPYTSNYSILMPKRVDIVNETTEFKIQTKGTLKHWEKLLITNDTDAVLSDINPNGRQDIELDIDYSLNEVKGENMTLDYDGNNTMTTSNVIINHKKVPAGTWTSNLNISFSVLEEVIPHNLVLDINGGIYEGETIIEFIEGVGVPSLPQPTTSNPDETMFYGWKIKGDASGNYITSIDPNTYTDIDLIAEYGPTEKWYYRERTAQDTWSGWTESILSDYAEVQSKQQYRVRGYDRYQDCYEEKVTEEQSGCDGGCHGCQGTMRYCTFHKDWGDTNEHGGECYHSGCCYSWQCTYYDEVCSWETDYATTGWQDNTNPPSGYSFDSIVGQRTVYNYRNWNQWSEWIQVKKGEWKTETQGVNDVEVQMCNKDVCTPHDLNGNPLTKNNLMKAPSVNNEIIPIELGDVEIEKGEKEYIGGWVKANDGTLVQEDNLEHYNRLLELFPDDNGEFIYYADEFDTYKEER